MQDELAGTIVRAVLDDLERRKGIKSELEALDADVREEMVAELTEVVAPMIPVARTCAQLAQAMIQRISDARAVILSDALLRRGEPRDLAAREYALAITHTEDALMRFTRGKAHELGVFKPADLEDEEAVRERHDWTGRVLEQMDEPRHDGDT